MPLCPHMTIYRAKLVAPNSSNVVDNGAVCIYEDAIVDIGPARRILSEYSGHVVDLGDGMIVPALVNVHSHLELSGLKWRLEPAGNFHTWVRNLIKAREDLSTAEAVKGAIEALKEMVEGGVAAILDVGNSWFLSNILSSQEEWEAVPPALSGFSALEIIAPLKRELNNIGAILSLEERGSTDPTMGVEKSFSAHSGFTVAPDIIVSLKSWTRNNHTPFSIHAAESPEEMQFFQDFDGPLTELLRERGHWPLDWRPLGSTPVTHLDALGVLDSRTVLVHCVHLDQRDLEIIKGQGAWVCLCPRSNTFIGVGEAPISHIFQKGLKVCIGTDSLASNDKLSIWHEMRAIASAAPSIDPAAIFHAATLGGATALGMETILGSLERGKMARMVLLKGECRTNNPYEWIVQGEPGREWEVELLP